jgi:hypothetical protein
MKAVLCILTFDRALTNAPMMRETEYAMDKDTYKHLGFTQATRTEHTEMRICLENFKGDKRIG